MFNNINTILSRVTKNSGIKKEFKLNECIKIFVAETDKCIGSELTKKIKPLYIKNSIITIASLSDKAVKEIRMNEKEIITKVNARMGNKVLKIVRYLS